MDTKTIIDISLIIACILYIVITILLFKQLNEYIDYLKKELDIKDHDIHDMTAMLEEGNEFYKQHFNRFVKRNKDITLEQFIEKYSDELAHIIVYVPETKTTEELITELENKLKKRNKQE